MSTSKTSALLALAVSGIVPSIVAQAAERVPADRLSVVNFFRVQKLIRPQPDESLWRHIPWETSLNEARRKAAVTGKPLLIWSGGGSAPLGGC
ncbi:MAG: hypothetical protein IID45_15550 [Planctomycetes bacterium]|nr:hypothetical protein [Planctomycetota bacterium]